MEGTPLLPGSLDAFAGDHPEVTLDLRAWVQDGRGGTWVQGSTEAELLAELTAVTAELTAALGG
jgi:hypothetical protein